MDARLRWAGVHNKETRWWHCSVWPINSWWVCVQRNWFRLISALD